MPSRKSQVRMPSSARGGLALLLVGAILVGIGTYAHRGALSFYGLVLAIIGFLLYIVSSIIVAKRTKGSGQGHRSTI